MTSIIVRADDEAEAAQAFRQTVTWFLLGLRALDERPDYSDLTCERILAWLRADDREWQ